jgi:hypothetical protein
METCKTILAMKEMKKHRKVSLVKKYIVEDRVIFISIDLEYCGQHCGIT